MNVLYIVMPAYNEEETIAGVIDEWYKIVEKYNGHNKSRLVVVDDGSKDYTGQIIDEEAKRRPYLVALHKKNGGHGQAILYGYDYAIKHGADYIFQTDSDGQTLPTEFDPFWKRRRKYDMVIGKRTHRQDGKKRVLVTRVLRLVLLACFQRWIPDANTPFRLMKADVLSANLDYIEEGETLTNVCISAIYAKKGLKVKYRPITFRERQGGVNSINIKKITRLGLDALKRFVALDIRLIRE